MENFRSKVFQFNILNWNWMEFDLVIIEVSFCGGRLLIYMEFKRLCRYSIYIISRIRKLISIIYWSISPKDSIINGMLFWVYHELYFKWHWFFNPVKDRITCLTLYFKLYRGSLLNIYLLVAENLFSCLTPFFETYELRGYILAEISGTV